MATVLLSSTVLMSLPTPTPTPRGGTVAITTNAQRQRSSCFRSDQASSYAGGRRRRMMMSIGSAPTPPGIISEKVSESIKKAEEACAGDPVSGECVAAWDEVEELSAAASHARDKAKDHADPLEAYCKDNPEVDECRTYED